MRLSSQNLTERWTAPHLLLCKRKYAETGSFNTGGRASASCFATTYDFLLVNHINFEPISYRFRDKRRFWSKFAKCFLPRAFNANIEGFPVKFSNSGGTRKKQVILLLDGLLVNLLTAFESVTLFDPSCTVSDKNSDFGRESQIIFHRRVFNAPLTGFRRSFVTMAMTHLPTADGQKLSAFV